MFQAGASSLNPAPSKVLTNKAQCVNNGVKTLLEQAIKMYFICVYPQTRGLHMPLAELMAQEGVSSTAVPT